MLVAEQAAHHAAAPCHRRVVDGAVVSVVVGPQQRLLRKFLCDVPFSRHRQSQRNKTGVRPPGEIVEVVVVHAVFLASILYYTNLSLFRLPLDAIEPADRSRRARWFGRITPQW
jgi:hypothetical protein